MSSRLNDSERSGPPASAAAGLPRASLQRHRDARGYLGSGWSARAPRPMPPLRQLGEQSEGQERTARVAGGRAGGGVAEAPKFDQLYAENVFWSVRKSARLNNCFY